MFGQALDGWLELLGHLPMVIIIIFHGESVAERASLVKFISSQKYVTYNTETSLYDCPVNAHIFVSFSIIVVKF